MTTFKSLKDLVNYVNKTHIKNALENEVEEIARRTLKENVITEVYDRYNPSQYKRTGELYQDENIESKMEDDNTLSIRSVREENGKDISRIIEEGVGYDWEKSEIYQSQPYPRPFHAETRRELEEQGLVKKALVDGLKKQGIKVK
jgi:hypothetical protein